MACTQKSGNKPRNKVLLVDDDANTVHIIANILKNDELDIYKAYNGQEALDLIFKIKPDIIITDLQMPILNGWELFQEAHKITPDSIFIFITGYGSIPDAANAIKKGVFDYIEKPFYTEKLKTIFNAALEYQSALMENKSLKSKIDFLINKYIDIPNSLSNLSKIRSIAESTITINDGDSEDDILKKVLKSAIEITNSKTGYIFKYNKKNNELSLKLLNTLKNKLNTSKIFKKNIQNTNKYTKKYSKLEDFIIDKSIEINISKKRNYLSIPIEDSYNHWGVLYIKDKISSSKYNIDDFININIIIKKAIEVLNQISFNKEQGVFYDESKKIREEYRILQKQKEYIDNSISIFTLVFDKNFKILKFGDNYIDLFHKKHIETGSCLFDEIFWRNLSESIQKKIEHAVSENRSFSSNELISLQELGEHNSFKIKVLPLPMMERDYKIPYFILMLEDITEHERIRKRLQTLENFSIVGRLFANIAHDLNNPLDGLNRLLKILEKKVADKSNVEYFQMMYSSIKRMANTIRYFLESTRNTMTKSHTLSVSQLLDEVIFIMSPIFNEKDINITKEYLSKNANMNISTDFFNVFINIIKNAYDAMCSKGSLHIKLIDNPDEEHINIVFADNGCGIPDSIIGNLTKPFFTTKEEGTGLGLALCEKIVKYHDGKMTFENLPQGGAQVTVSLPITKKLQ